MSSASRATVSVPAKPMMGSTSNTTSSGLVLLTPVQPVPVLQLVADTPPSLPPLYRDSITDQQHVCPHSHEKTRLEKELHELKAQLLSLTHKNKALTEDNKRLNDEKTKADVDIKTNLSRPPWIAKERKWPLPTWLEALQKAAQNGGQYPCAFCEKTQEDPIRIGGLNWCTACSQLIQRKTYVVICPNGHNEYFEDPASKKFENVSGTYGELTHTAHGCVPCGWTKKILACDKCHKLSVYGELSAGQFTCSKCKDK